MKFSGKQLTAARNLLGITQGELAAACGISLETISRFERGDMEPRRDTLLKIEAELERRGIDFTNGTGIGVHLNYERAAEYARLSGQAQKEADG